MERPRSEKEKKKTCIAVVKLGRFPAADFKGSVEMGSNPGVSREQKLSIRAEASAGDIVGCGDWWWRLVERGHCDTKWEDDLLSCCLFLFTQKQTSRCNAAPGCSVQESVMMCDTTASAQCPRHDSSPLHTDVIVAL
mgnify:CR=1 FL=1